MRISGGELLNREIITPHSSQTRPVTDRIRSSIFNTLSGSLNESRVLDLYAGSGSLGIEALSRGSYSVVFVENSAKAIATIAKNLNSLQLGDKSAIVRSEVGKYLAKEKNKFDLIFADPPYDSFNPKLVEKTYNLLKLDGLVVLSTSSKVKIEDSIGRLKVIKSKKFGDSQITYLQR
jgi:16S rRNA (guanine(966)-N(2))-methyltransferase RsmD